MGAFWIAGGPHGVRSGESGSHDIADGPGKGKELLADGPQSLEKGKI